MSEMVPPHLVSLNVGVGAYKKLTTSIEWWFYCLTLVPKDITLSMSWPKDYPFLFGFSSWEPSRGQFAGTPSSTLLWVRGLMSQTHQAWTRMEHRWWGYEWRMNLELDVTRLWTLDVVSNETMNLGIYGEHEDKDEEGHKIEWNENTRLICQWLVLNPLKGTKDVTNIYTISEIEYL